MKKIISIILSFAMCFSLSAPVSAAEQIKTLPAVIYVSESVRLEVTEIKENNTATRASEQTQTSFLSKQYVDDELVQIVEGEYGGKYLTVTNYKDGLVSSTEIIPVSSRIVCLSNADNIKFRYSTVNATSSLIGRMVCEYSEVLDEIVTFHVYSELINSHEEIYMVNGFAGDSVNILASALASAFGAWVSFAITSNIIVAIVIGVGGTIIGGAISNAISEPVNVEASSYSLSAYNTSLAEYCDGIVGTARHVTTDGDYYDEWFYEGFTPYNWEDEDLGYYFWYQFYDYSFPGISYCL